MQRKKTHTHTKSVPCLEGKKKSLLLASIESKNHNWKMKTEAKMLYHDHMQRKNKNKKSPKIHSSSWENGKTLSFCWFRLSPKTAEKCWSPKSLPPKRVRPLFVHYRSHFFGIHPLLRSSQMFSFGFCFVLRANILNILLKVSC